jgi:hypothetical protein
MRYAFAAVLVTLGRGDGEAREPEVWVFFSPDSPDASGIFAGLRGARVRPVLLTERYFGNREPSEAFLETVKAAGEIRVVDEEGLREAVRLGLASLPAVAVTRRGRTHVAFGNRPDVREVLRCAR